MHAAATRLALLLLLASPLAAQNALYVEHRDAFSLVVAALGGLPLVKDGDKLVRPTGHNLSLQKVEEFAPFFVSVRNLNVHSSYLEVMGSGSKLNNEFQLRADFESPFPLENVFLLLDLSTEEAGKAYFIWEIGKLVPRQPKPVEVAIRLSQSLGEGHYQLHLFANGRELFHSLMPLEYVDQSLDRMVARRIKDVTDAAPKPFVGPGPEYPAKLRKAKIAGEAVLSFTVSPRGRVLEPTVVSATDPAFGESALVAARLWRFLPRVKNAQPVTTKVNMPFVFTPEEKAKP